VYDINIQSHNKLFPERETGLRTQDDEMDCSLGREESLSK